MRGLARAPEEETRPPEINKSYACRNPEALPLTQTEQLVFHDGSAVSILRGRHGQQAKEHPQAPGEEEGGRTNRTA